MKTVYTFKLSQQVEKDKVEISKDLAGAEIKKTTKVKEPVEKKYVFSRPNRSLQESVALFQAKKESEYLRSGILSVAQIHKKIFDDNTLLTESQKEDYQKLRDEWIKVQSNFLDITKKPEKERSEEEKKNIEKITEDLSKIYGKMRPFEEIDSAYNNLYNNTAEFLARSQATRYLTLMCSYEEVGDNKYIPFFGEGDYEAKLKKYDEIEESEDKYLYSLAIRFTFIANFYHSNKADSQDEYDLLIRIQEANGLIPKIESPEIKLPEKVDGKVSEIPVENK